LDTTQRAEVQVAFFDLDRTLIDVNSALLYARYERRHGRISTHQFLQAALWSAAYHLGVLDIESAYDKALAHYFGAPASTIEERTVAWFDQEVAWRLLAPARRALDDHRARGHRTVLLSNTSCYQAVVASERWGLDAWLANHFQTDSDNRISGGIVPPMCYGAGKVTHAERWCAENNADIDQAYFYTDSISDVPMLERVAHPVVVNPDPRLARYARKRGWPIHAWSAEGYDDSDARARAEGR